MVAEKTMRFTGAKKSLDSISKDIVQKLMSEGYQTQSTGSGSNIVIQARKEGVLRDIIAANRAFTIQITGNQKDFTVKIGIGKFVQNLAVTAVEALVLSELFLVVDVPEMIWTKVVKDGIEKDIIAIVGKQPAAEQKSAMASIM